MIRIRKNQFTKSIRKTVDDELKIVLNKKDGCVKPFSVILDNILKSLKIHVYDKPQDGSRLQVSGKDNGYECVTYLFFYIRQLLNLNYIDFVDTTEGNKEVTLGDKNYDPSGVLSANVSDFIKEKLRSNILVSPEFKEYVKANHVSRDVKIAKQSVCLAYIAVVFSIIASLLQAYCCFFK